MRWKSHVRFGERAGETDQPKGWHRAPARLHFMTRRDLHDRRAGRRNSEPYGLSVILSRSIQERQIDVITMAATRETDTGDIEERLALPKTRWASHQVSDGEYGAIPWSCPTCW